MRNLALALLAACASAPSSPTVVVIADEKKPTASAVATDDSPCASDADCAFTRVGAGETACCPMLCTPRVVTKKRAKELEDRIAVCSGGRAGPQPGCPPPREKVIPCVPNKGRRK